MSIVSYENPIICPFISLVMKPKFLKIYLSLIPELTWLSYLRAPYHRTFVFQLHYHQLIVLELILLRGREELDLHFKLLAVQNIQMLVFAYLKSESTLPP